MLLLILAILWAPPPSMARDEARVVGIQCVMPMHVRAGESAAIGLCGTGGTWAEYAVDWEGRRQFIRAYAGVNEPAWLKHTFAGPGTYIVTIRPTIDGEARSPLVRKIVVH